MLFRCLVCFVPLVGRSLFCYLVFSLSFMLMLVKNVLEVIFFAYYSPSFVAQIIEAANWV